MIERLIEKLAEQHPDSNHRLTVEDFATWLKKNAAPVVERQEPIGYVDQWELDRIAKKQAHWATLWNSDGSTNPSRGGDSVALYAGSGGAA